DGIRDGHVTGVQTCALPIYNARSMADSTQPTLAGGGRREAGGDRRGIRGIFGPMRVPVQRPPQQQQQRQRQGLNENYGRELLERSEERRVGEECRSRGAGGQ